MAKKPGFSIAACMISPKKLWLSYRPYFPDISIGITCLLVSILFNSDAMGFVKAHSQLAIGITSALSVVVMCLGVYHRLRPPPCYLIDFCCTEGEGNTSVSAENFDYFLKTWRSVKESNLLFQFKVFLRSGIGEESYAPPRLIEKVEDVDIEDARAETESLISKAATRLLKKASVDPREVDIVIVNSSLFNPVPSLAAYVVNKLNMRSNVKTFNLAGMGCSAGLVSIDLAKDLLKVHKNSYVLVVSTENITKNMYFGNDRSMMVSNCLFRCGSAAILLTNKPGGQSRAKMQLLHCLRTNLGADQMAYECVHHKEDEEGKLGVSLQLSLVEVAGKALRANITKLAPLILPLNEMLKVVVNLVKKNAFNMAVKAYEPNFKKAIDHFCIHPGGRAVIDSIGKGLKLSEYDIEPGKMALNRFGNTSSSGIWYALAYCEAKGRLRKGNKVWQIALGSGFKCNSGVWRVMRDIQPWESLGCNPWLSCIHRYPVTSTVEEHHAASIKANGFNTTSGKPELNQSTPPTAEPLHEEVKG